MGIYSSDLRPIEEGCECECCQNYTRAALHLLFRSNQSVAASILSIHNLYHQKRLMTEMREAIIAGIFTSKKSLRVMVFINATGFDRWPSYHYFLDTFPQWVEGFIKKNYGEENNLPEWAANGLAEVGIDVRSYSGESVKGVIESSTRHDLKKNFKFS